MSKTYKTDEEKKKRSKRSNGSTEQKENKPAKNTKNQAKDGISKSKQLLMKEKMCRRSRTTKSKEPRVCPNGKPIPTLADLEKMFDDSDEESTTSTVPILVNKPATPKPVEPQSPVNSEHKLLSPTTINRISERMMELISNVSDPVELIENISPSPVIPPKKRKKPEQPYIVGCKDRPQVIKKSNANFCKGDADYGVNNITNSDEDVPPCKRGKRSKIPKYSKSIFNAQSDKIADHLKNIDSNCNDSSDSDKTIEYEYMTNSIFAPLPSTSRDNETFIKNDELFSESLKGNNTFTENEEESKSDLEVIEIPTETIVIEEVEGKPALSKVKNENEEINNSYVQIVEPADQSDTCIVIDLEADNPTDIINNDINKTLDEHGTINIIDDDYSSIQFDVPHNSSGFVEGETIDVDELIAQSQSIIQKYKRDSINTVIDVNSISTKPTLTSNNINNEINEQLISDTQVRNTVESLPLPCNSLILENEVTTTPNQPNNAIEETVTKFFSNMQNIRPDFLNSVLLQFDQLNRSEPRITKENQISNSAITVNCDSINTPSTSTHNNNRNSMESLLTGNRKQTCKKKTVYNSPESPSSSHGKGLGDCPICMDCLTNNPIASTICGHVFCLKCIEAAVKANGKRCPTCRKLLKKNGYHQLFI